MNSLSPRIFFVLFFISAYFFFFVTHVAVCFVMWLRPRPNQDARVFECCLDEVSGRCDNA